MDWIQLVQVIPSVVLVIATGGLWYSTRKYQKATESMATVTKDYKDIVAAQLLREVRSDRIEIGGSSELKDLNLAIRAHAPLLAEDLLGEGYTKKVKIRGKGSMGGSLLILGELKIERDKVCTVPLVVWKFINRNPELVAQVEYLGEE